MIYFALALTSLFTLAAVYFAVRYLVIIRLPDDIHIKPLNEIDSITIVYAMKKGREKSQSDH